MKHICAVCGYVYDDEKEKIPFSEVGDDFERRRRRSGDGHKLPDLRLHGGNG